MRGREFVESTIDTSIKELIQRQENSGTYLVYVRLLLLPSPSPQTSFLTPDPVGPRLVDNGLELDVSVSNCEVTVVTHELVFQQASNSSIFVRYSRGILPSKNR